MHYIKCNSFNYWNTLKFVINYKRYAENFFIACTFETYYSNTHMSEYKSESSICFTLLKIGLEDI